MSKPFIYIGALRRTGSTMLCEALTQLPHSLVFNEPNLAFRRFVVRNRETELLASVDIDLEEFKRRWSLARRRFLLTGFRRSLVPRMSTRIAQVGIKEIFHGNWHRVRRRFPSMCVVLTARDPRDIYISLKARHDAGAAIWQGPFTPARVADNLNAEFRHQLEMADLQPTFKARYEDLCSRPSLIQSVLKFVDSDISTVGELGGFLAADHRRVDEGRIHGGKITDQRVGRWRSVRGSLAEEAHEVFRRMPEFCAYWDYTEDEGFALDDAELSAGAAASDRSGAN